jgi:CRP-like cAMP-binding protein
MERLIQTIRHFIKLSAEDEQQVATLFKEKQFSKGEYFLQEGGVCRQVGFIQEGLVRYFINKDDRELTGEFGKEGDFVCNYCSFLDRSLSEESIQCLEDTRMLVITFDELQVFYNTIAEGNKFGRLIAESLFVSAKRKIASMYIDPPETRYLQFLQLYPELQQRIPQYYISSYVGVKPPSLSRIRKRLSQS